MRSSSTVFDYLSTGAKLWHLGIETNNVIALRMMGMAGIWNTPFDENWRMVAEKPRAFLKSGQDGLIAAMAGLGPDKVVDASIVRLKHATTYNRRRLSARGIRKP